MTSPKLTLYSKLKTESILSKIRNKTRMSTLAILFNKVLEVLVRVLRKETEIKEIKVGKEVKPFADDMILYVKNP